MQLARERPPLGLLHLHEPPGEALEAFVALAQLLQGGLGICSRPALAREEPIPLVLGESQRGSGSAQRQSQTGSQPRQGGARVQEVRVPRGGERLRQPGLALHRGVQEQHVLRPSLLEQERQGRVRGQRVADDRDIDGPALQRPDHRIGVARLHDLDTRQLPQQLPPDPRTAVPFGVGEERVRRDDVHDPGTGPRGWRASWDQNGRRE